MRLLKRNRRKQRIAHDDAFVETSFDGVKVATTKGTGRIAAGQTKGQLVAEVDEREDIVERPEETEDVRESSLETSTSLQKEKEGTTGYSKIQTLRNMISLSDRPRFLETAANRGISGIGRCADVVNEKSIVLKEAAKRKKDEFIELKRVIERKQNEIKQAAQRKHNEFRTEGPFDFMCGSLETACGLQNPALQKKALQDKALQNIALQNKAFRTYRVTKSHPKEKIGLSFVAFKDRDGIFVCKIKEKSKFLHSGLEVGMRVICFNGQPCPTRVGELMKQIKAANDTVEFVVEKEEPDELSPESGLDDTTTIADGSRYVVQPSSSDDMTKGSSYTTTTDESNASSHTIESDGHVAVMMDMLLGQHNNNKTKKARNEEKSTWTIFE
eukprot:scaffold4736_cov105-Cylindrotheca_fusiformis.AAC.2